MAAECAFSPRSGTKSSVLYKRGKQQEGYCALSRCPQPVHYTDNYTMAFLSCFYLKKDRKKQHSDVQVS